jgi:hypothetical protein
MIKTAISFHHPTFNHMAAKGTHPWGHKAMMSPVILSQQTISTPSGSPTIGA